MDRNNLNATSQEYVYEQIQEMKQTRMSQRNEFEKDSDDSQHDRYVPKPVDMPSVENCSESELEIEGLPEGNQANIVEQPYPAPQKQPEHQVDEHEMMRQAQLYSSSQPRHEKQSDDEESDLSDVESHQAQQVHKENEHMHAQPNLQQHSETESNGEQSQPESHSEISKEENLEGHVAEGQPETNYHGQHHSRPTYGIKQPVSHSIRQPPPDPRESQSSHHEDESDHSSQMSDEYEQGHNEPMNVQKNDGENDEMESDFDQPSENEQHDERKETYMHHEEEDEDKLSDSAYKNHAKRLNEQRNYWPSANLHQKKLEDSYNQQNKMMYFPGESQAQPPHHDDSSNELSDSPEPKQAHPYFNHEMQAAPQVPTQNLSNIHSSQNTFLQTGDANMTSVNRAEKEPHHLLMENEPS